MKPVSRDQLNLFFLSLLFVWNAMQLTVLQGLDGKGRIVMSLSILAFILNVMHNARYRRVLFNRKSVFSFWKVWFLYAGVNTVFQFQSNEISAFNFITMTLFVPLVVMSIVASLSIRNIRGILRHLLITIYITFAIFSTDIRFADGRINISRFDPNEFSLLIYLLMILIGLRFVIGHARQGKTILLLILPLLFVVFLGSRMGFAGTSVLVMGMFLLDRENKGKLKIKRILLLLPLFLLVINLVLSETVLGDRLSNTTEEFEQLENNPAEGTVFENFGDRGLYYILGWEAFLDEPIFGIGLRNFQGSYYGTVLHSEHVLQLAELGALGFLVYIIFIVSLFRVINKLKNKIRDSGHLHRFLLISLIAVLFAGSVLFLYQSIFVAAIYGLIIMLTKEESILLIGNGAGYVDNGKLKEVNNYKV